MVILGSTIYLDINRSVHAYRYDDIVIWNRFGFGYVSQLRSLVVSFNGCRNDTELSSWKVKYPPKGEGRKDVTF
jgi:hypothetical protein